MKVLILREEAYEVPTEWEGTRLEMAYCCWKGHGGARATRWFALGIEGITQTSPIGAVWVCDDHAQRVRDRRFTTVTWNLVGTEVE